MARRCRWRPTFDITAARVLKCHVERISDSSFNDSIWLAERPLNLHDLVCFLNECVAHSTAWCLIEDQVWR